MDHNKKHLILTNDVEDHSIWFNKLRYETGRKVLEEGMPILLDIYSKYNIKSTFFFTGYIAENFPDIVKMILPYGHEVASHGYSHEVDQAFDVLPYNKQVEHLQKSKKLLEDLSGQEVVSFRAPALRINSHTASALTETGYKIDSSVASQRFDLFFSYGSKKKLKWLTAKRKPYRTSEDDLTKKGNGNIIEVPLSAFIFPFTSTTLRIFPRLTFIQKRVFNIESSITSKPIVFDIHPNEFIDESTEERIIERRTKNLLAYLLKDIVRAKLKVKNLGEDCIPLYKRIIDYYLAKNYRTSTIKNYCIEQKLI